MSEYSEFTSTPRRLTKPEKAAAILLAMGKPIASKLLKFFDQDELQTIITQARTLRSVPSGELSDLVNEFEDLFTEGAGLMDNARAMEGILEEGLTADEVDGLLGRQKAVAQKATATVWDRLESLEAASLASFLDRESPQTAAYIVSRLPSAVAGKVLIQLPQDRRADLVHRTLNLKEPNARVRQIIEARLGDFMASLETGQSDDGPNRIADMMNELEKTEVDQLLGALETISSADAEKIRPKVFLFDDLLTMPVKSRVTLFDDISGDVITTALQGASESLKEAVLSSIGARQRRMIETELSGEATAGKREIAVARRSVTQEAIRLAAAGTIALKETGDVQAAA